MSNIPSSAAFAARCAGKMLSYILVTPTEGVNDAVSGAPRTCNASRYHAKFLFYYGILSLLKNLYGHSFPSGSSYLEDV
jgi:hypothetical protein